VPASRGRYVFLLPWVLTPGGGVNAVVLGLASVMRERHEPVFVITGWDSSDRERKTLGPEGNIHGWSLWKSGTDVKRAKASTRDLTLTPGSLPPDPWPR